MCTDCENIYPESLGIWRSYPTKENACVAVADLERCLCLYNANANSRGFMFRTPAYGKANVGSIDFAGKICNNYDCKNASESICSFLNILCCGMLKDGAKLYGSLGMNEESERLSNKANMLEDAIVENLYDRKLGLFIDATSSEHHSLCVNASAIAFGIRLKSGNELIASYVKRKRLDCDASFANIVVRALENLDEVDMAEEVLYKKGGDVNG